MKSRSKTLFVVLPILLLCVGGIWYWRKNADDRAAMSYLTETVRRGEILATVNASGELDAVVSVDVGAQVSGQIERLYVELGQQVKRATSLRKSTPPPSATNWKKQGAAGLL